MKNSKFLFSNSDIPKTKKYKRLSKLEQASLSSTLPNNLKDIIVGSGLGDLFIEKTSKNGNARLTFRQSVVHKEYLEHLFGLFKIYSHTEKLKEASHNRKTTNKVYNSLYFKRTHCHVLPSYIVYFTKMVKK